MQVPINFNELLKEAQTFEKNNQTDQAIDIYNKIINTDVGKRKEGAINAIEEAIYKIAQLYENQKRSQDLSKLNESVRPLFKDLPKAKTAKIVRTIIEHIGNIPNTLDSQIEICKESIEWATREKRTFLRQRIESRLAYLFYQRKEYDAALKLTNNLIREVRRLDDKALLVEIHLVESKIHHALHDPSKARAALTSSRTAANAIYCPPLLQAEIDLQSGILHAEEKDYKTAYSYFYEAFEGFNNLNRSETHQMAVTTLKYLLLVKIMTNNAEEVQALLSSKNALKYSGQEVDSMRAVTNAYQDRSLYAFDQAKQEYKSQLLDDPVIYTHLSELYDNLLEQHLQRVIEPYSRVQISHVAELVGLTRDRVERKLSQMILDKKLNGILDQGKDCLVVFEEQKADKTYPSALSTVDNMNVVLDSLFERARQLTK
ncbi:26S proteasome subunit Rpn6 [Acrasis kona]|uniref:26S proteasome subunit Rpn6 n=1 Tax=Acrasis kona TaxID=1008807 RepID=A0AAW2Z984_9EUKA